VSAHLDVVDTHIHFWDLQNPSLTYAWLDSGEPHAILGDVSPLRVTRYSVEEYLAETRFEHVRQAVHVQAAIGTPDPVAETRWIQALSEKTGWPHAAVAYCDLAADDADQVLRRHLESPLVRGVRETAPADFLGDPRWRRGYRQLGRLGLVYFHELGWPRMPLARRLAADCPDVILCVDQTGMPLARDAEYFRHWRASLTGLAAEPNVICKISSLGTGDPRWTIDSLRPWVRTAIEAFGPDRCMIGSNWPVDRLFSSYPDLICAYRAIIADLTTPEQAMVLSGTADRVLRLDRPGPPQAAHTAADSTESGG
jgi:predicted TIM-barrel fold metal-dependent hydrolase